MDKWVIDLAQSLGGQWLSIVFIAGWFVYKSGFVPHMLGVKVTERGQLSADQQLLVQNLQAMVAALDLRLTEQRAECDAELAHIRAECDRELRELREEIASLIRGEERWRHLTGNLASYVAALRATLRKADIEVPRFNGWDRFIEDGGDPLLAIDA